MRRAQGVADWLMLAGAVTLFVSLFLTWSHQLPRSLLDAFAGSAAIQGTPRDPTAWQVYSVADVVLTLLGVALAAVALRGRSRWSRLTALAGVALALAFVAHAESVAPTNGVYVPSLAPSGSATPGTGEIVALIGLGLAAAGLLISLGLDLSSNRVRSSR